jgi:1-phosphatidylinositol-4-phosphate 5-kinase
MVATVVSSRTMPSVAADGSDSSTYRHAPSSYTPPTRTAPDKPLPPREYAERQLNGNTPASGKFSNGVVMHSTTNGRPTQPSATDKRSSQTDGTVNNQRGWGADTLSPYKSPEGRDNSGKLPGRDDGYFAAVQSSEVDDSCTTTHVKLGGPAADDGNKDARSDLDPLPRHDLDPRTPPAASTLEIPNASYRVSSPAAFNRNSNPTEHPYRLQHRHTLEVPKLSAGARPLASTDDVVTASGRFSPNTPTRRRGSMSLARRATRSIHSDMHLEEVPQDEDAARWAEHIRQKRASKRKRKEEEDDDRVVVGTKVDQHHVNWVTAYNMLTGIRFTVSRTNAKMDRELTDADFEAKHKFSFDMYVPDDFSLANLLFLFGLSCGLPSSRLHVANTDILQNRK